MKTFLFLIVVLAAVGAAVYYYLPLSPEERVCSRLDELCGDGGEGSSAEASSCEEDIAELEREIGPKAVERMEVCVAESDTCTEAVACMATGVIRESAGELIEGIKRGLGDGE